MGVRFHRLCAVALIAVVTIHGVWMLFATEFEYLGIGEVSLPGLVSLLLFLVVAAGAHPWVRRNYFNVFYTLHSLLILASVFSVLHIPSIALYLLVPAGMWFLFFVAHHIRAYRARQIASCTLLTSGTTAAVTMSFVWPETWADPRPIVRVSLRAVSFLFSVAPFLHCDILERESPCPTHYQTHGCQRVDRPARKSRCRWRCCCPCLD